MTDLRRASRAGVLLPIALLFAACGGGTTATVTPTATATAGTDGVATASPTTGVDEASPSGPDLAIPSFDVGVLTKGLANLDSYQVSITAGSEVVYKGTVVTKPVLSRDVTVGGGTRVVVIGDKAWMAQGGGALTAVPASTANTMFAAFDPALLVGAFSGGGFAASSTSVGAEQKNGVSAQHYRIDSTSPLGALASLAPGATVDVWIADKGFLVALETKGVSADGDLSIQVTNVDDPANKVETPS